MLVKVVHDNQLLVFSEMFKISKKQNKNGILFRFFDAETLDAVLVLYFVAEASLASVLY